MFEKLKKAMKQGAGEAQPTVDPVCGMKVQPGSAAASRTVGGQTFQLCSAACAAKFDGDPNRYANPAKGPAPHHHTH